MHILFYDEIVIGKLRVFQYLYLDIQRKYEFVQTATVNIYMSLIYSMLSCNF